jgi:CubicO group peptidase (beta-lactamase class C family)
MIMSPGCKPRSRYGTSHWHEGCLGCSSTCAHSRRRPHPRKSSPTQCAATRYADRSWGYGVALNLNGSWSWDGGLGSSFWIHPELDLSVIVLTQRLWDSPDLPLVHREIRQAAIDVFT